MIRHVLSWDLNPHFIHEPSALPFIKHISCGDASKTRQDHWGQATLHTSSGLQPFHLENSTSCTGTKVSLNGKSSPLRHHGPKWTPGAEASRCHHSLWPEKVTNGRTFIGLRLTGPRNSSAHRHWKSSSKREGFPGTSVAVVKPSKAIVEFCYLLFFPSNRNKLCSVGSYF